MEHFVWADTSIWYHIFVSLLDFFFDVSTLLLGNGIAIMKTMRCYHTCSSHNLTSVKLILGSPAMITPATLEYFSASS